MLSVFVPIRNSTELANAALVSIWSSIQALRLENSAEIVIVDDGSDAQCEIPQLVQRFRQSVKCPVVGFRLAQRGHYTLACSTGFSLASGNHVLLISHDMIATPSYISTLLGVAALDPLNGVVRGMSRHVDAFPQHVLHPSPPVNTLTDVSVFSALVTEWFGLTFVEDHFLIGDSMLITRTALNKVGVMDTGFVGFLGDVDFGLRVQRAGMKLVCAKGAWLHHEGSGLVKTDAAAGRADMQDAGRMCVEMVRVAYIKFRAKWDPSMPVNFDLNDPVFATLRYLPPRAEPEYVPPLVLSSELGEPI